MKRSGKWNYQSICRGMNTLAVGVVKGVGAALFVVLTWYSLRYTQYMIPDPLGDEIPINAPDSMLGNLLFLILSVAVFKGLFVLEKRLSPRLQQVIMGIALALPVLLVGIGGAWWITALDRQPVWDQAQLVSAASCFMEGDYSYLAREAYCGSCPHQLGQVALLEILFRVVGPYNYFACQVLLVVLAVGIVLLGFALVRCIAEHMAVAVSYCLLMLTCIHLICYTGWIYGDLPSIFFILLAAVSLLCYTRKGKLRWLAVMVVACIFALLVRKNSILVLIALCLVAGIHALSRKDKRLMVAVLLAAVLPNLAYTGIFKMYEYRSGIEHSEGFSNISYIAMGMQEYMGKCGWYTFYCNNTYHDSGFDTALAEEISKQDIRKRLEEFKENPSMAVNFYREKLLSQWNAPLYQAMYFGAAYAEGIRPEPDSLLARMNEEYFPGILQVCNRVHFFIFVGMLFYFLFAVRKNGNMAQHLLAVTIIGGFFFSIIWEAKARYIFPYYITMFPLAVVGYSRCLEALEVFLRGRIKSR